MSTTTTATAITGGPVNRGAVHAGFWVMATVTVVRLVPQDMKGKALAMVAGGLTIATVIGVPIGTALGQHFGWRATVWAVAALSAIGILATIPSDHQQDWARPELRREFSVLANPRLWLTYVATAMSSGQSVATLTYLGALLVGVSSVQEGWVPLALVVSGVGSLLGLVAGGRFAHHPFTTLAVGFSGSAVSALLLLIWAGQPVAAVMLTAVLQFLAFATNPSRERARIHPGRRAESCRRSQQHPASMSEWSYSLRHKRSSRSPTRQSEPATA
jgi:MFS transporter, DHA1 family, chloramphenicol resistance protein